jgi:hypothetical protein
MRRRSAANAIVNDIDLKAFHQLQQELQRAEAEAAHAHVHFVLTGARWGDAATIPITPAVPKFAGHGESLGAAISALHAQKRADGRPELYIPEDLP